MVNNLKRKISAKADQFSESVIREMTRVALQYDAVNLAQGFPDFSWPDELKAAACEAIAQDVNQYAITWGDRPVYFVKLVSGDCLVRVD
jgi:aminotransferase